MRVLDTETGQFAEIDPEAIDPSDFLAFRRKTLYAILSHTWDAEGEQTYEELKKIQQRYASPSSGIRPVLIRT
ncbi:hypothetical protein GSI_08499 [Ganoderma sinense ZZ0214-1]|uniref:Uncharacterized protein n=1 Tax=Ganoderma sinense ZZ0214-1 TaxID=1077348 RepID=A0A2G8S3X3_9APHY|nr:hypothetical protein GSI_08499 [Ganoderma sinense ZZ0214-1]